MPVAIEFDRAGELVVSRGREAWQALRRDETFEKWVLVGRAIEAGKEATMRALFTNRPTGRQWSETFGSWLAATGFDEIDPGVRSRLQRCIENLPAIEQWRQTLTLSQRLQYNHPNTVLRRWQAATNIPKPPTSKPQKAGSIDERLADGAQKVVESVAPEAVTAVAYLMLRRFIEQQPKSSGRPLSEDNEAFRRLFWATYVVYPGLLPKGFASRLNCTLKLARELHAGLISGMSEREFVVGDDDDDDEALPPADDWDDDDE